MRAEAEKDAGTPRRGAMSRMGEFLAGREWVLLLAILATAFCLRMTFLHEPFERDEGGYAYIGQEVLRGSVPYKDVIDIKPPLVYYLYAAGMTIFGETTEGIRIFTAFYCLGTAFAVFLLARCISGTRAGLAAAFLYGVFGSGPLTQGSSSNTEVFLVLPLVLGTYFLARAMDTGRRVHLVLCGTLYAVAMLIKTVAFPFAVLGAAFAFLVPRSEATVRDRALDLAALLVGPAVLALLTLAYFFLNGALEDFLYWNVTFPFRYRSADVTGPPFFRVTLILLPEFLPLLAAAVPMFLWLLFRGRGRKELIVALSFPAALIGVILPGKNFPHYFIQLFPPLAVLAGIGLARLFEARATTRLAGALAFCALFALSVYQEYRYYLVYSPYDVSAAKYGPTFVQSLDVARYVKERTLPTDYIFQWGFEMELYFLTSRRAPVPFMASSLAAWSKDPSDAIRRMIAGINEKKPKYIVYQPEWGHYPGVVELGYVVERDYQFENMIAYAQIYRRK